MPRSTRLSAWIALVLALSAPLRAQVRIAVVNLSGYGVGADEAAVLSDRLRGELFRNPGFRLLEREAMDQILKEQGFQQSGCVSQECIVETGRLLGVEEIVAGSVSRLGEAFSLGARRIKVETGEVVSAATFDHSGRIEDLLIRGVPSIAAQLADSTRQRPAAPIAALPAAPVPPPDPSTDSQSEPPLFGVPLVAPPTPPGPFTPFQVSFAGSLRLFPSDLPVVGVAIDVFHGRHNGVFGVNVGLVNDVEGDLLGVQAGLVNTSVRSFGVQAGLVNRAEILQVLQAGLVNRTKRGIGVQVGLVNNADELHGVQVGLINRVQSGPIPFMPIVNISP